MDFPEWIVWCSGSFRTRRPPWRPSRAATSTTRSAFRARTSHGCNRRRHLGGQECGGLRGSACQDVLIPNLTRRARSATSGPARHRTRDRPAVPGRARLLRPGDAGDRTDQPSHRPGRIHRTSSQYPHDLAAARELLDEAGLKPNENGERVRGHVHARRQSATPRAGAAGAAESRRHHAESRDAATSTPRSTGSSRKKHSTSGSPRTATARIRISAYAGSTSRRISARIPFRTARATGTRRSTGSSTKPRNCSTRPSRREKYVEIQRILADDVPYFWLVDSETLRAHRSTFTGFRLWTGAFAETVRPVAAGRR